MSSTVNKKYTVIIQFELEVCLPAASVTLTNILQLPSFFAGDQRQSISHYRVVRVTISPRMKLPDIHIVRQLPEQDKAFLVLAIQGVNGSLHQGRRISVGHSPFSTSDPCSQRINAVLASPNECVQLK